MKIIKSTRHSKITGDFGENLVLYLLSSQGFECAIVDHTGIDIIANNPETNELMGISVKARSRYDRTEGTYINISADNFIKAEKASKAFKCDNTYFAIVSDGKEKIYVFILPLKHLKSFQGSRLTTGWKMAKKHIEEYRKDKKIRIFEFDYKANNWWGQDAGVK